MQNKKRLHVSFEKYMVNYRYNKLESSSVAQYLNDTGHNINIRNLKSRRTEKYISFTVGILLHFLENENLDKILNYNN